MTQGLRTRGSFANRATSTSSGTIESLQTSKCSCESSSQAIRICPKEFGNLSFVVVTQACSCSPLSMLPTSWQARRFFPVVPWPGCSSRLGRPSDRRVPMPCLLSPLSNLLPDGVGPVKVPVDFFVGSRSFPLKMGRRDFPSGGLVLLPRIFLGYFAPVMSRKVAETSMMWPTWLVMPGLMTAGQ